MKYKKMLGLFAVAAAVFMVFVSSASATLTSPAGTKYTGWIHAHSEGWVSFTGNVTVTCSNSTFRGFHWGGEGGGEGIVWDFSSCGNHTVTTSKVGSYRIQSNGALYSTGTELTVLWHSIFLGTVHCVYVTSNTDIGDVTGGTPPTIDIASANIPRVSTDSACSEHTTLEGSYAVYTPGTLFID